MISSILSVSLWYQKAKAGGNVGRQRRKQVLMHVYLRQEVSVPPEWEEVDKSKDVQRERRARRGSITCCDDKVILWLLGES